MCGVYRSLFIAILFIFAAYHPVPAANLPAGFTETLVASGLPNPTAMAFAPDGRLFVCQQGGQLRVIKNGSLLPAPFLGVTVNSTGERGLLGIAFDPNFAVNQYVYIYYTATTPAVHNRVSRFTAGGDTAVPGSETVILELNNLSGATNHNGGAMHFGEDGKLYIGVGDNAEGANAQTLNNLLGKILRINPDGSIPEDNPFHNAAAGNNRAIWALGLRNPFTFAFQPGTRRMLINDVGQNTWEEINDGVVGSNYGWPVTEGPTSDPRFRGPIYAYQQNGGTPTGCAITGGTFYDPAAAQFPSAYVGDYYYADYCGGWIWKLDASGGNTATQFATGISFPVDMQVGPEGSLYYLARGGGGAVYKIQYTANVNWQIVGTGDYNSDGQADLVWQHQTDGQIGAWLMDGSERVEAPLFTPAQVSDTEWKIVGTGDFNGDNRSDLVWQHRTNGQIGAWLMNGSTRIAAPLFTPNQIADPNWKIVGTGDFNADGRSDLVWQHRTDGLVGVWLMSGTTLIQSAYFNPGQVSDTSWKIVGTGDFNADGKADLVWQRQADGQIGAWLMDGSERVEVRFFNPGQVSDTDWKIVGVGDFNKDGQPDLVWRNWATGLIGVWIMNGTALAEVRYFNPHQAN